MCLNVVSVLNKRMTKSPALLPLLQTLALASVKYNLSFTCVHRPGVRNVTADVLSRPDKHHFKLDPLSLSSLAQKELESSLRLFPPKTPEASQAVPSAPLFASFFFHDHITNTIASKPLTTLKSSELAFSATLSSLVSNEGA